MVRLLRLHRLGDLGALHDGWAGWMINARSGELVSPSGYTFEPKGFANWPSICERARLWQQDYERRAAGGVGALAPARPTAVTLQPEVWQAEVITEALPSPPTGADSLLTALCRLLAPALEVQALGSVLAAAPAATRVSAARLVTAAARNSTHIQQRGQEADKPHSSAVCDESTWGHDGAIMGPSSQRKCGHVRGDQ